MPALYMVATPIGNLKDITIRALDILRMVDTIVCEDTRHSQRLLGTYDIHKPLMSCHGYNEENASLRVIEVLKAGRDVAYVSDAGTPGISDPGGILVDKVAAAGFQVLPIPGPSALAALVSVAGLAGKRIAFDGFLSPKSGRRKNQLKDLLSCGEICVVYESPFRIVQLIRDLYEVEPAAQVVVGRELTKLHEEIIRGPVEAVLQDLQSRSSIKGEFVVAIHPPRHGRAYDGEGESDTEQER